MSFFNAVLDPTDSSCIDKNMIFCVPQKQVTKVSKQCQNFIFCELSL